MHTIFCFINFISNQISLRLKTSIEFFFSNLQVDFYQDALILFGDKNPLNP